MFSGRDIDNSWFICCIYPFLYDLFLLGLVLASHDAEPDIGPVKPLHYHSRVLHIESLQYLVAHRLRSGRRERQHSWVT